MISNFKIIRYPIFLNAIELNFILISQIIVKEVSNYFVLKDTKFDSNIFTIY